MSASRAAFRALATGAFLSAIVAAAPAYGAQRTFVSGTGLDANPCSLPLPCRTFTAAMAQTAVGGEIVVLDSAGYGGVDINQSISITVPPGVYGGVTVTGPWGISISGATTRVALRGLTFNSLSGYMGVVMSQGLSLSVEDCTFNGFSGTALQLVAPGSTVLVRNTTVRDGSGSGISLGTGVDAVIDSVRVLDTGSGSGIGLYDGAIAVIRNSVLRGNAIGIDVNVTSPGVSRLVVEDSLIAKSGTAGVMMHTAGAGAGGELTLSRNTITRNAGPGVRVSSTSGATGHATINDNVITRNTQEGIYTGVFSSTLTVLTSNNTVTMNSVGFLAAPGVAFRTRTNNTVENNASDLSGTPTSITAH
jgi:hypothetical protein